MVMPTARLGFHVCGLGFFLRIWRVGSRGGDFWFFEF